jgi:small subunit ribosomal protein S20
MQFALRAHWEITEMPQRRTAIKEFRKNHTRHMHNLDIKTDLKKTLKAFVAKSQDKGADTKELLKTVYKKLDKAAKRNVMHKKTAARRKSRFARMLASGK